MNFTIPVLILKTLFITGAAALMLPFVSNLNFTQSLLTGLALSFILYAADLIIGI